MNRCANRTLRGLTKLPMQWSLAGRPTWHAPRRTALSFTPVLGAIVLPATALDPAASRAQTSIVAAAFVATHALHLALLLRKPGP